MIEILKLKDCILKQPKVKYIPVFPSSRVLVPYKLEKLKLCGGNDGCCGTPTSALKEL